MDEFEKLEADVQPTGDDRAESLDDSDLAATKEQEGTAYPSFLEAHAAGAQDAVPDGAALNATYDDAFQQGVGDSDEADASGSVDVADEPQPAPAAGSFFAAGVAGIKETTAARKAHAAARDELERLEATIREREQELDHRRDVGSRFDQIVAAETAHREQAEAARAEALSKQEDLSARVAELKAKLDQMKEADAATEKRLKTALEAAEDKEKFARESGRRLQRRLDDANRNLKRAERERTEGVAAAEQAIKSAQTHLATLNDEFTALQRNPSANPAEYSVRSGELEVEISDATEALRLANEDLPRVKYETQEAIEAARAAVAEAEKPIAAAKASFDAVAKAADEARATLSSAKDDADARQKDLRRQISDQEKAAKEQARAAEDAEEEAAAAQAAIDEATDIHEHPEATESLAQALEADRAEHIERAAEVEELAAAMRSVRERTRGARTKLIAAIVGVVLVIVLLIIWTFVAR